MNKLQPNVRMCLLLAGSDLTESEMRRFLLWLQEEGTESIERAVKNLRLTAARGTSKRGEVDTSTAHPRPNRSEDSRPNRSEDSRLNRSEDPLDRVMALLYAGTGLLAEEGAARLADRLQAISVSRVPTPANKPTDQPLPIPPMVHSHGVRAWLEDLAQMYSFREILQAASQINTEILGRSSHWPLRDRKES